MCIIVIIAVLGINAYYENMVEFLCIYFLNAPFIMYSFIIKMSHVCVGHEYTNKLDMWSVLYTESTNFVLYVENTTVFIWKCQVLSWWHSCKESFCRRHTGNTYSAPVSRFPWRRKWQPTPVFLPGKSHGQRSLTGYSPWCHKELDMI